MIMISRTFTVTAAPAPVHEHLRDFGNTTTRETTRTGGTVPAWHTASKAFGVTIELTYTPRVDEPGRLVFAGHSESATATDTITLRPVPAGTEVSYRLELEVHGLAKLATPLVRGEFEKLGDRTAAHLAETLNRLAAGRSDVSG
jgi:polyketide cyclase/dehydrase/lipid transport protein